MNIGMADLCTGDPMLAGARRTMLMRVSEWVAKPTRHARVSRAAMAAH
jgi:hypothetical protein